MSFLVSAVPISFLVSAVPMSFLVSAVPISFLVSAVPMSFLVENVAPGFVVAALADKMPVVSTNAAAMINFFMIVYFEVFFIYVVIKCCGIN
jgi:hypothetical protein